MFGIAVTKKRIVGKWQKFARGEKYPVGSFLLETPDKNKHACRVEKVNSFIRNTEFVLHHHLASIRLALKLDNVQEQQAGFGGFSTVFRATDVNGRDVALKLISADFLSPHLNKRWRKAVKRELYYLSKLNHRNLLTFYEHIYLSAPTVPVKAYCVIKTEYLDANAHEIASIRHFTCDETVRMARQVMAGLEWLHDRGLVHHDIKPQNIMVSGLPELTRAAIDQHLPNVTYKLVDFGMVREYKEGRVLSRETHHCGGTAHFLAPEKRKLNQYGNYNPFLADSYAFAITLAVVLFGPDQVASTFNALKHNVPRTLETLVMTLQANHRIVYGPFLHLVSQMIQPERTRIHVNAAQVILENWYQNHHNLVARGVINLVPVRIAPPVPPRR